MTSFCSGVSGKNYFDLDGDEELRQSSSQDGPTLTWRGDPAVTLSDWTIMVVTNELYTETYHVHKSVLCFGSRQSKYFARIMTNASPQKNRKQNVKTPTTKVELDQTDADNFPLVLDYIYAPGIAHSSSGTVATAASTLTSPSLLPASTVDTDCSTSNNSGASGIEDLTTENAVSVRHLARLFEIDSLTVEVNRFIQKDLSFETGPSYLLKASNYKDERLLESAKRLCADSFEQLDLRTLMKLPVNLFRTMVKALESYDDENRNLSIFVSDVVCRYLEKHPNLLCAELLVELTDPLVMPYISSEASIGITALIKELDINDATLYWKSLVSLSRRCATSVVQEYGWNDFSVNAAVDEYLGHNRGSASSNDDTDHDQPIQNHVSRIDSLLFATSFAAALEQAQDDYEEIIVEQQRLESTVDQLRQTIDTLEKTHQLKDDYMAKQQRVVEDAKKQIMHLKQQVTHFKRQNVKRTPNQNSLYTSAHLEKASPIHECRPKNSANINGAGGTMINTNNYNDALAMTATTMSDTSSVASPIRELISPSQVGRSVHANKRKVKELMTKDEMRSRSLLV